MSMLSHRGSMHVWGVCDGSLVVGYKEIER